MKNIIVTGSTGFIGQYMLKALIDYGYEVYIVVRKAVFPSDVFINSHCHVIISDLADLTTDLFPKIEYDTFLHMGWSGVNRNEIDDSTIHLNNYNNSLHCLHIANALHCSLFADTGSRAEYGNDCDYCSEENIGNPSNAYGCSKLKFYKYAFRYCKDNSLNYIHFRLFSVIGPNDHPWSLVTSSCKAFLDNEEVHFGACSQLWNFMSVDDACEAIITVMQNYKNLPQKDNLIVNIASADTRILKDYIESIFYLAHSSSNIIFDPLNKGYSSNPSIDKLTHFFSWKDKTSFEEEILKIIACMTIHLSKFPKHVSQREYN